MMNKMMNKTMLRVAGSLTVMLAFALLLWWPSQPWISLKLATALSNQSLSWSVTGYELLLTVDGLAAVTKMLARLVNDATSATDAMGIGGLLPLLGVPVSSLMQIQQIAALTESAANIAIVLQILFFVLPLLSVFMAVVVAVSRTTPIWMAMRSALLLTFTALGALLVVGVMIAASTQLDRLVSTPDVQNALVNLTASGLRLDIINTIGALGGLLLGLIAIAGAALTLYASGNALPVQQLQAQPVMLSKPEADMASPTGAPVALPMAQTINPPAVMPPLPTPQLAPMPASAVAIAERTCPSCGRALSPNAKFCSHCGSRLG